MGLPGKPRGRARGRLEGIARRTLPVAVNSRLMGSERRGHQGHGLGSRVGAAWGVFAPVSGQAGCYVHHQGGHVTEGAGGRDQVRDTAKDTA